jgi:hypothetical protein
MGVVDTGILSGGQPWGLAQYGCEGSRCYVRGTGVLTSQEGEGRWQIAVSTFLLLYVRIGIMVRRAGGE